jgi:anaerobic selenocysteine-containing dehydrogenase
LRQTKGVLNLLRLKLSQVLYGLIAKNYKILMAEVKSTCCYCGVGCGVIIETTANAHGKLEVTGVRGDPNHPANFRQTLQQGLNPSPNR